MVFEWIDEQLEKINKYVHKKKHTVWGKVVIAVFDSGVSVSTDITGNGGSTSINIGNAPVMTFDHNKKENFYIDHVDEHITKHKAPELVNNIPDNKIDFRDYMIDGKRSLIESVIQVSRIIPHVNVLACTWDASCIVGSLYAKCSNDNAKRYFRDAEISIENFINDYDKRNEALDENVFRKKIEQEVDFACDRMLEYWDPIY